jgi:environmental stress-induced protein Ves
MPKLHIVRQASFTATAWKNGGGITHEAMRMPPSGDRFRWRVSVAHIDASGPFSDFAAYNRKMVLLRGAGIDLRFDDGEHRTLRQVGELVEFDGARPVFCELLNGPCVDLNLMVSKPDRVAVSVERLYQPIAVSAAFEESALVFPIDRSITLLIDAGESVQLEPWDLAVLSDCNARVAPCDSAGAPAHASEFVSGEQQAGFRV